MQEIFEVHIKELIAGSQNLRLRLDYYHSWHMASSTSSC
jgi:hypothetical protein